ncbi:MAG: aminotransferase class I/II-fold pyridoxal phosphate-dependent enzyme [Rubrivivax sp.]
MSCRGARRRLLPLRELRRADRQDHAGGKRLANDSDVVMDLLERAGVALVAGTAYGLSPYFRVSIATSMDNLEEGCRRIAAAAALR